MLFTLGNTISCQGVVSDMNEYYMQVVDANNLMSSARHCLEGVNWKYSSQSYYLNRINRVLETKKRLENMDRMSDGFIVFTINERGKEREVSSIHINERVVHRCENDFALMPELRPRLIYDTYSSLQERGTSRCFERLKCNLQREYRKYGDNKSYIVVSDLHAYFKSINHGRVYEQHSKVFKENNPKVLYLTMDFVDAFGDVSLGLGSQVSQITAAYYPNDIDHYIKEQLQIKGYGRYNDDFYMIHRDKDYLIDCCLPTIKQKYAELGIEMNANKTVVCQIGKEFKFLKAKIHCGDTGKIYMRPDKGTLTRERRKLRKMREKLDAGLITFDEINQQYKSWRGHIQYFNSYRSVQSIDELFNELFIKEWRYNNDKHKQRKLREYRSSDYKQRQHPAERRYGLELQAQWDGV